MTAQSGAAHASGPCPHALTQRQAEILRLIQAVHAATAESCSAGLIARRLGIRREAARDHLKALERKGWLVSESQSAMPRRPFLAPRG